MRRFLSCWGMIVEKIGFCRAAALCGMMMFSACFHMWIVLS